MEETLPKEINRVHGELEYVRKDFEPLWQECTEVTSPRRSDILGTATPGQKKGTTIYDGTGISALNLWCEGLQGYHISPAIRWFMLVMPDKELNDNDEVRAWLQACDDHLCSVFRRSNFYDAIGLYLRDSGSTGNAAMFVEEDLGENDLYFTVPTIGECYFATDARGRISRFHRKFKLTVQQVADFFKDGTDKLSTNLQNAIKNNPSSKDKWIFLHAIFKNKNYLPDKANYQGKRWLSCYKEFSSDDTIIRKTGYYTPNPAVWRVRTNTGEPYGYGPASDAIVELNRAQNMGKTMMEATQFSVNPRFNVPKEMKGQVNRKPGGYNYYEDERRLITPVQQKIDYPFGVDREDKLQIAIEKHFKVRFFSLLTEWHQKAGKPMTATQIIAQQGEQAALMGPMLGTFNNALNVIFDRVIDIELEKGIRSEGRSGLPPPPDIVLEYSDGHIDVDYIGPLAQAQKRLFKTQGIMHAVEALQTYVLPMFPDAVDKIDGDELAEEVLESHGMPQKLIRSDEDVEEIREARAKIQEAVEAAQMAAAAADAVPKLQKKTEKGSPLAALEEVVA